MSMTSKEVQQHLRSLGSPETAKASAWFFKTGPGQYGEGDCFVGVRVPTLRKLARQYQILPLADVETLLHSEIHEERLLALLILVLAFANAEKVERKTIFDLYLGNTNHVNNWDLVDASAPYLVGAYLIDKNCKPLYRLVKASRLWERRIAIVATQHFIRHGDFADTLEISRLLLGDKEDLIQKATGWMLREVGKRHEPTLEAFLERYAATMPRTMLRYAIERFPEGKRQEYLRRFVSRQARKLGAERPQ
jgi:3-methyladenine DNA glycosylase AlkD